MSHVRVKGKPHIRIENGSWITRCDFSIHMRAWSQAYSFVQFANEMVSCERNCTILVEQGNLTQQQANYIINSKHREAMPRHRMRLDSIVRRNT